MGLYEQTQKDIFLSKGFEIVNPPKGKYEKTILKLKNNFGFGDVTVYHRKKDKVMLVSDGEQIFFLTAPNGMNIGQVYKIGDIQNEL